MNTISENNVLDDLREMIEAWAAREGGWNLLKAQHRLAGGSELYGLRARAWHGSGASTKLRARLMAAGYMVTPDGPGMMHDIVPDPFSPMVTFQRHSWRDNRGERLEIEPVDLARVYDVHAARDTAAPMVGDMISDGRRITAVTRDANTGAAMVHLAPESGGRWYYTDDNCGYAGGQSGEAIPMSELRRPEGRPVWMAEFWLYKLPAAPGREWRFEIETPVWEVAK